MSLRNIFTKVSIQRNNRGICELANLHSQCIIWMLGDPIYFSLLASTSSNSSRKFPPKHSSVSSSRILQDSLSSSFYQLCDQLPHFVITSFSHCWGVMTWGLTVTLLPASVPISHLPAFMILSGNPCFICLLHFFSTSSLTQAILITNWNHSRRIPILPKSCKHFLHLMLPDWSFKNLKSSRRSQPCLKACNCRYYINKIYFISCFTVSTFPICVSSTYVNVSYFFPKMYVYRPPHISPLFLHLVACIAAFSLNAILSSLNVSKFYSVLLILTSTTVSRETSPALLNHAIYSSAYTITALNHLDKNLSDGSTELCIILLLILLDLSFLSMSILPWLLGAPLNYKFSVSICLFQSGRRQDFIQSNHSYSLSSKTNIPSLSFFTNFSSFHIKPLSVSHLGQKTWKVYYIFLHLQS